MNRNELNLFSRVRVPACGCDAIFAGIASQATRLNIRWYIFSATLCALTLLIAAVIPVRADLPHPVEASPEASPAWLKGYEVRYLLRAVGNRPKSPQKSLVAQLPTGGWLKADASDLAVQCADGARIAHAVLSHDPQGDTIVQFPRHGDDVFYWVYARSPQADLAALPPFDPSTVQEGLSGEIRTWEGDDLDDWSTVRTGLTESRNVIGNVLVAEVVQNCNPVRNNDPRNFAASYRGYLKIETDGVYRFFLNAEDAAFLFIDGFKVTERVGTNSRLSGRVPLNSLGGSVELKKGVHPFEVHHVLGNNPTAIGYCALMWAPEGATSWAYVPRQSFQQADYAQVAGIEHAQQQPAPQFVWGVEDTLRAGEGGLVYLVKFAAVGSVPEDATFEWDFGDGTKGTGRAPRHVYFQSGNYRARVKATNGMTSTHNVHVWPAPGNTSPLSLRAVVDTLASSEWQKFDFSRLHEMFQFLLVCEQPERWPLLDAVSLRLLEQPELDLKQKILLYQTRMESLASQGKADEALALGDQILNEFKRVPSLQVSIKLAIAQVYERHLKKHAEASQRYEAIVNDHRRVEHPNVRIAAIRWGDLFAESGDLRRAGECYKVAAQLGGEDLAATTVTGAATRGGLLRTAEQKLRGGDIQQTRQLLERIELHFPQQKLEGLYRLLRADADRQSGRYEEALRNYEILLKLTQWSGFNDRALYGIADTYYRLADWAKAVQWLDTLKESHPAFYEKQKLDELRTLAESRLKPAVNADGSPASATLSSGLNFVCSFEPGEPEDWGKFLNFKSAPGLGIIGPHVGLGANFPAYLGYFDATKFVEPLNGNGEYWVEMWYRETLASAPFSPHTHMYLYGETTAGSDRAQGTSYFSRTFGQWRRFGFLLKAPLTSKGRFIYTIRQVSGVVEIDGVSIRAITDREADALNNFLKGSDAE